ncbi:surface lipoprotein assembly modifier, partial [Stenotrophomonas maltophilia]
VVRSEHLAVAGLVPSLSLRYARIDSNVGWLYSHDRSLLSLKWERAF